MDEEKPKPEKQRKRGMGAKGYSGRCTVGRCLRAGTAFLAVLTLFAAPAYANPIIVPMVSYSPLYLLLLVPIIVIEAGVCRWITRLSVRGSLGMAALANGVSTVLGIPLSLRVLFGQFRRLEPGIVLLVFALNYLVAVAIEYVVARYMFPANCRNKAGRWSWLANSVTYGLLLIVWIGSGMLMLGPMQVD